MTGKTIKNQYGDEIEMEFELTDIMQEILFDKDGIATNDEKVMEENIVEILRREKLWKKNYSLIFPSGSTQYLDVGNTEDDLSTYQYDFEIFSDSNTVIASGTYYGSLLVFYRKRIEGDTDEMDNIESVEVCDMTLEICEYKKTFHDGEEKEKVCFT